MLTYSSPDDTIAAIATAPGIGAIGVIRLSGRDAVSIAGSIFKGRNLARQAGHTALFGRITDNEGREIDEVVVTLFRNPHSYTGEDVVEISGHGSPYILSQILDTCLTAGARLAQPGEFTQRAFLNGKMDLAQAEAVGDLIVATSEASRRTALHQLRGGFSADLNDLRDKLIHFSAMIELELDFAEEDVEFADRDDFRKFLTRIKNKTNRLIASFRLGNAIKNGFAVAIIGRPNAGKSTLLNNLLNEERAIVSNIAGTTRDTIEETLNISGYLFRLIDTAGIRSHTDDLIESMGIERSRVNAERADIIIHVRAMTDDDDDIEWLEPYRQKIIEVSTKFDLYYGRMEKQGILVTPDPGTILMYPDNYEPAVMQLKEALFHMAMGTSHSREDSVVTNARHYEALKKVAAGLDDLSRGLDAGLTGDLLALDIRRCLHYLGEITGRIDVDRDVLGKIFSSFCIGK